MSTFWAVLKTSILIYKLLLLLFGQLLDIFGLLYISASGHTGCDLNNDASIASIDDRFRGNCHDVGIPTYNCIEKLTSSSRLRDQKFAQRVLSFPTNWNVTSVWPDEKIICSIFGHIQ